MALTLDVIDTDLLGRYKVKVVDVTFDASYPAGGESLSAADLGFRRIEQIIAPPVGGHSFEYDRTNSKLKLLAPIKKYTAAIDAASMVTDAVSSLAVTVTGVAATDICVGVQPAAALEAGLSVQSARVTDADEITVELANFSAGTVDGASADADFYVVKANGAAQEITATTDVSTVETRVLVVGK